jgi:hypothetical protein
LRDFPIGFLWYAESGIRGKCFPDVIECLLPFVLFQEPLYPFHHMFKEAEVDVMQEIRLMQVRRVHTVESGEYITAYL